MIVQDERAHKFALACKGFACKGCGGIKLCALCSNVVSFKCDLVPDITGFLVPSSETEVSRFALHTNATVRAIQVRLAEVAQPGQAQLLEELETPRLQLRTHKRATIQLFRLEARRRLVFDWVHCYCVDGIFLR